LKAAAKLVALLGVSGSGKSAVARRLVEAHGFTLLRFGDPVRDMLKAGFGLTDADFDGMARNQRQPRFGGLSAAHLQNTLANAWGRGNCADLWNHEFKRRVAAVGGNVVCIDVNRQNEADTVRSVGGILVGIHRPGFVPTNDMATATRLADIETDLRVTTNGKGALASIADELVAGLSEVA
jgi:hypothetical protein